MSIDDRLVNLGRQAEVIRINDQPFHLHAGALGRDLSSGRPSGEVLNIVPSKGSP
jgi:hypothetical protein